MQALQPCEFRRAYVHLVELLPGAVDPCSCSMPLRLERLQAHFGFVTKCCSVLQVLRRQPVKLNERSLDAELSSMRSSAYRLCTESMPRGHDGRGGVEFERPRTAQAKETK